MVLKAYDFSVSPSLLTYMFIYIYRFPGDLVGKESVCNEGDHLQCRRRRFCFWVKKIPWRRRWQFIPVYLP